MKTEYITVKEFAEIAGVSIQSIYKRLSKENNPLTPYFKEADGKKLLQKAALWEVYNLDQPEDAAADQPAEHKKEAAAAADQEETAVKEPEKIDHTDRFITLLEKQLQEKDRQLQEKDQQINAKDKQIESLLQRLEEANKLIDQQQQLAAIEKKDVLQIEDQEKKKGLFAKLFGK